MSIIKGYDEFTSLTLEDLQKELRYQLNHNHEENCNTCRKMQKEVAFREWLHQRKNYKANDIRLILGI